MKFKARLESIDQVLNEIEFNTLGSDKSKSAEYLKRSGEASHYILIEVSIEEEGQPPFRQLYIRGFEGKSRAHIEVVDGFRKEMAELFPNFFHDNDRHWPFAYGGPASEMKLRRGKADITIKVVGGGKYSLTENSIQLSGSSLAFGRIPNDYAVKLHELLEVLVKKPQYSGYSITSN